MQDDTIAGIVAKLAERTAAPAGGATAALNAALAAALLAMSARFCDGRESAGQAVPPGESAVQAVPPGQSAGQAVPPGDIVAEADRLREACAALIAADGESYAPVMAAFKLRKDTDEQRAARSAAIAAALVTAAGPPAEVIAAAARLLELARALEPMVNR